jgi:tetratricopeptide (TPR) repeat protein
LEPDTGKSRWTVLLRSGYRRYVRTWWPNFDQPFRQGDHIQLTKQGALASTSDGCLALLDVTTGKQRWAQEVGEVVWHAPRLMKNDQEAVVLGQMGTATRLRLSDGAMLWRGRISQAPLRRVHNKFHHTPAIRLERGLLFGAYQEDNRFVLRTVALSFGAAKQTDTSKEKALSFARQLRAEKRFAWADTILSYAADTERGEDHAYFSALSASAYLSKQQRLRWMMAKLRHAADLRGALVALEPTLRSFGLQKPLAYFSSYDKQAVKDYVGQFLLYYWSHRKHLSGSMEAWWQLVRSTYRVDMLHSPLASRVMLLLLKEGSPAVRWWAAATLAAWGSSAGRRVLLEGLAKRGAYRGLVLNTLQQDWVMRLLVRWSYALRWEGLLLRRDLAEVEPLLRSHHPLLRNLSALFLAGYLSKDRPEDQRFDTPLLRATLRRVLFNRAVVQRNGYEAETHRMQAAMALAHLGERAGIEGLRRLVRQTKNDTLRNRAARLLFFEFGDAWGRDAIFASVQGTNQKNLQLPAFQLIFAQNLFGLKEYRQALAQYRKVQQMPSHLLSPTHRAMAMWGMVRALAHLGRYEEALSEAKKLSVADPSMQSTLSYIQGYILWKQGKDHLARPLLERFLREHPANGEAPNVRGWLAQIHLKAGRSKEALAVFAPIFVRDQGMRRLALEHFSLAKALLKAKVGPAMARIGLIHIREALKLRQDQPRLLAVEAELLHLLGQNDSAKQRMLRAIRLDAPQSPSRRGYQKRLQLWESRKVGLSP